MAKNEVRARIRAVIEEVERTHDGEIMSVTTKDEHTEMYACKQCSGSFDPRQSEMVQFPCPAVQSAWWLRRIVLERE